jgi:phosphoribosylanthranilate isomerase
MTNAVVIDVSSGVESEPGIKNEEMIKNFIDTTKSAFGKRDE